MLCRRIINDYKKKIREKINKKDIDYLIMLSKQFPTIESAVTEIINLNAILNLPKETEHFISDLHGEYEAFIHVKNNASGGSKTDSKIRKRNF